jgi:nitric oxide dioxygenase
MLTPDQVKIIKATAPVVGANAQAITGIFYPLMFATHPELKSVFNQTHQQSGGQPAALANAIVAYATHIDNLGVLSDAVQAIMQKHVSLNIQPDQYKIVGAYLMEAIGKVLGDAVTPEIADAWGAAYWQLADILIGGEEKEYARKAALSGGWRGARKMRLIAKDKESDVITSFTFVPADGKPVMDFTPGQYVGIKFNVRGETVHRNYSRCRGGYLPSRGRIHVAAWSITNRPHHGRRRSDTGTAYARRGFEEQPAGHIHSRGFEQHRPCV